MSRDTKVRILNGALVADIFRGPAARPHSLFKVIHDNKTDEYLRWEEVWNANISLEGNKKWMTVHESGVYLVYVQLTYSLKNSPRVDLSMRVEFGYPEGMEEFIGAFDTRQPTDKEQDAHLSKFFLLHMKDGNRLSIKARPKERIKYNDVRPFSSFITIVRYADWSG
ncbi:hypothetical protein KOW79_022008 [Hemibagrus wyckioides]|uniref:THD domain-containing protein n=2 Tax=Hemibagrus wyckioides TaxID=337641 RepID=A0A9D3S8W7_9TELE|nr:hypothetical protein KOW79_022008 [Hemibagrus wyckioides]